MSHNFGFFAGLMRWFNMTPEGSAHSSYGLTDEDIEELRMITSFDPREICRLEEVFYTVANSTTQSMTKEQFFSLASVRSCPLRERIALIFGFPYSIGNDSSLNKPTDPSAAENVGENKADADESTGSDKDDRDSGNKESVEEKEDVSKERPGKHENITKVDQHAINFREFLTAVSMFNSSGMLEQKMKVAFRLQVECLVLCFQYP